MNSEKNLWWKISMVKRMVGEKIGEKDRWCKESFDWSLERTGIVSVDAWGRWNKTANIENSCLI